MKGRLPVVNHNQFSYGKLNVISTGEGANVVHGAFCSFAENIRVMLGGHHHMDFITTYPFGSIHQGIFGYNNSPVNKGNVVIGNDVWIGDNVTIMPGITIGDGAVIGCNTVVTKDAEPYSIMAGNPGRFIRYRFSEEVVEELLNIKWWDLPLEVIQAIVPYLTSTDIGANIHQIKDIITRFGIRQ
jgi:acetyltransferase-like isoleucine patch superfamily enzyme